MIREIDRTYPKPPDRGVPPPRSGQPPLEVLTGLEHGSPVIDAGLHQPGWMLGRSDLGNERRRRHGIFEAMARAGPVAAYRICAVPEMLDFGDCRVRRPTSLGIGMAHARGPGRRDHGSAMSKLPAADHFSLRIGPVCPEESSHPLAMNGIEPQALRDQVARASGTDVAIIAPQPDCVLLTLPQLYKEVRQRCPQFNERWSLNPPALL